MVFTKQGIMSQSTIKTRKHWSEKRNTRFKVKDRLQVQENGVDAGLPVPPSDAQKPPGSPLAQEHQGLAQLDRRRKLDRGAGLDLQRGGDGPGLSCCPQCGLVWLRANGDEWRQKSPKRSLLSSSQRRTRASRPASPAPGSRSVGGCPETGPGWRDQGPCSRQAPQPRAEFCLQSLCVTGLQSCELQLCRLGAPAPFPGTLSALKGVPALRPPTAHRSQVPFTYH